MAKYIISTLIAVLLNLLLSTSAQAQIPIVLETEDMDDADRAKFKKRTGLWTKGMYLEVNAKASYQIGAATPAALSDCQQFMPTIGTKFAWSYISGLGVTGFVGPELRAGLYFAHGNDAITGEGLGAASFVLQPGFFHGNYVGNNWLIVETISLPMVMFDPGFQIDVGMSWVPNKTVALEFGVSMGYFQTNLEIAGKELDWFSIGPFLQFNVEALGWYE